MTFFSRLLIAAYLLEAGLLLIMAPWTFMWARNYFGELLPWLGAAMEPSWVRGAVSGVGLICAWTGLRDLVSAIIARWSTDAPPSNQI